VNFSFAFFMGLTFAQDFSASQKPNSGGNALNYALDRISFIFMFANSQRYYSS
jgi:hypothetical protein